MLFTLIQHNSGGGATQTDLIIWFAVVRATTLGAGPVDEDVS